MLDVYDQSEIAIPDWNSLERRALLPKSPAEFLTENGPKPVLPDSRRRFHRAYFRSRAVARCNEEFLAVYLTDISRSGLGLYSPIQLFPCEEVELWVEGGRYIKICVKACLREMENCYRCGGEFA